MFRMNRKKNICWNLLLGCGAGLLLAACTSDDIIPNGVDDGRVEIVGKNICALSTTRRVPPVPRSN